MRKYLRYGLEFTYYTVIWFQFWVTVMMIQFSFRAYFGDEAENLPEVFFLLWNVLILPLVYQSASFTWRLARAKTHTAYLLATEGMPFSVRHEIPKVLHDADFWSEMGAMLAFVLLMGATFPFDSLTALLFPSVSFTVATRWLINIPILAAILFAAALWAHVSVRRKWHLGRKAWMNEEKHKILRGYLWALVKVPLVYGLSSVMLVVIIKVLYPILFILWKYILLVLAAVLLAIAIYMTAARCRAKSKRRRFLSDLEGTCRRLGAQLSPIREPRHSVLHPAEGEIDFTVHYEGKRYDCKLIAGLYYSVPLYFDDSGKAIFRRSIVLFRHELMQWTTEIRYSFEAEGDKLLILSPTPKAVFLSAPGQKPIPIDTGDFTHEYQIFTSTGFLGALERNCIGRRANT